MVGPERAAAGLDQGVELVGGLVEPSERAEGDGELAAHAQDGERVGIGDRDGQLDRAAEAGLGLGVAPLREADLAGGALQGDHQHRQAAGPLHGRAAAQGARGDVEVDVLDGRVGQLEPADGGGVVVVAGLGIPHDLVEQLLGLLAIAGQADRDRLLVEDPRRGAAGMVLPGVLGEGGEERHGALELARLDAGARGGQARAQGGDGGAGRRIGRPGAPARRGSTQTSRLVRSPTALAA